MQKFSTHVYCTGLFLLYYYKELFTGSSDNYLRRTCLGMLHTLTTLLWNCKAWIEEWGEPVQSEALKSYVQRISDIMNTSLESQMSVTGGVNHIPLSERSVSKFKFYKK